MDANSATPSVETDQLRQLQRSAGAFAAHAKHGWAHMTAAAQRAANITRFEKQVDPEGRLPSAERATRADQARRAHMKLLAVRAVQARRVKAAKSTEGERPDLG